MDLLLKVNESKKLLEVHKMECINKFQQHPIFYGIGLLSIKTPQYHSFFADNTKLLVQSHQGGQEQVIQLQQKYSFKLFHGKIALSPVKYIQIQLLNEFGQNIFEIFVLPAMGNYSSQYYRIQKILETLNTTIGMKSKNSVDSQSIPENRISKDVNDEVRHVQESQIESIEDLNEIPTVTPDNEVKADE
jgi:hypothetical protein